MSNTHKPDMWQLIQLRSKDPASTNPPTFHVLSSWWGGWTGSDSWRLSTQITQVKDHPDYWLVTTRSGSQYELSRHPAYWGTSSLSRQVLYEHPVLEVLPNDLLENT